ncbi:hypothetical protein M1810_03945 [Lactiplantibacillus plantarum]|uniref:hypothetical protein n=1 Tax=Lactiplantibacillus plantarum TaxID=1590 RepID=UPI0024B93D98|nr:hypothetical protein [Lactiplantibacillus plantarum]WHQ52349.1 hypothetical protein M1852_05250 [Lactiplantibacillus plantarum]WHQ66645.1 hypothetical protein M1810_03945 [Lactiplantibacillus plantarum]
MRLSDILQIATMCVAVISIFISNMLGGISEKKRFLRDQKLKRYTKFYIPLVQKMYNVNPKYFDYFNLQKLRLIDDFTDMISSNFEFIGAKTAPLYSKFMVIGVKAYSDWNAATYSHLTGIISLEDATKELIEANHALNQLVEDLLLESAQLSQELGLEDISTPLLISFRNAPNHKLECTLRHK